MFLKKFPRKLYAQFKVQAWIGILKGMNIFWLIITASAGFNITIPVLQSRAIVYLALQNSFQSARLGDTPADAGLMHRVLSSAQCKLASIEGWATFSPPIGSVQKKEYIFLCGLSAFDIRLVNSIQVSETWITFWETVK